VQLRVDGITRTARRTLRNSKPVKHVIQAPQASTIQLKWCIARCRTSLIATIETFTIIGATRPTFYGPHWVDERNGHGAESFACLWRDNRQCVLVCVAWVPHEISKFPFIPEMLDELSFTLTPARRIGCCKGRALSLARSEKADLSHFISQ